VNYNIQLCVEPGIKLNSVASNNEKSRNKKQQIYAAYVSTIV